MGIGGPPSLAADYTVDGEADLPNGPFALGSSAKVMLDEDSETSFWLWDGSQWRKMLPAAAGEEEVNQLLRTLEQGAGAVDTQGPNATTEVVVDSLVIPGGSIGANGAVRGFIRLRSFSNQNFSQAMHNIWRVYVNGTVHPASATVGHGLSNNYFHVFLKFFILSRGVSSSKQAIIMWFGKDALTTDEEPSFTSDRAIAASISIQETALNSDNDITIEITGQWTHQHATLLTATRVRRYRFVERVPEVE